MQVYFQANDDSRVVVEALIDGFEVIDSSAINVVTIESPNVELHAYPNPFQNSIQVAYNWMGTVPADLPSVLVYNALGQLVESRLLPQHTGRLELGTTWEPGLYFIHIGNQTRSVIKQR